MSVFAYLVICCTNNDSSLDNNTHRCVQPAALSLGGGQFTMNLTLMVKNNDSTIEY